MGIHNGTDQLTVIYRWSNVGAVRTVFVAFCLFFVVWACTFCLSTNIYVVKKCSVVTRLIRHQDRCKKLIEPSIFIVNRKEVHVNIDARETITYKIVLITSMGITTTEADESTALWFS